MGDLFKKIILQTVFEGKNLARKYLGKNISCPEKNIPHQETISTNRLLPSWRIMMLGKILHRYMSVKKFYLQSKF